MANNPNRMRAFDSDIRKEIEGLARGTGGLAAAESMGRLAPSFDFRNVRPGNILAGGAGGAFYAGEPTVGAIGLGLSGAGLASRAVSNRMASNRMAAMTNRARGTPEKQIPAAQIAVQSMLPAVDLPSLAPEGQVLVGYGTDPVTGAQYPMYGYYRGSLSGEPFYVDEQGNYIEPR